MLLNLSERSLEQLNVFVDNMLSVLRMMVGAYFLAKAVGLMLVPGRSTLMHSFFSDATALTICATFFFLSGVFLLMGFLVQPISVLLASHVLSAATISLFSTEGGYSVGLVQSAILMAAVVLVGIGHPFKGSKFMEFLRIRKALRSKLPEMPELENMRQYHHDLDMDLTAKRPAVVSREERDEWGEDDAGNLFDELWERKPRSKLSQVA